MLRGKWSHQKEQQKERTKKKNIELGASCFRTNSCVIVILLKEKGLSIHVKGPRYNVESYHIFTKQRSHASYCWSTFDTAIVQNNRLSSFMFLEHSNTCQQIVLRFKTLNNEDFVIIFQHSMSFGNYTS